MPQFQNLRANIPAPICPGTDSPPRRNFLLRGAGSASPFPRLASGAPPYRVTSLLSQHPSRTRIFSRAHFSPASPQKQESAAAFRSSLARPASPVRAPAVSHSAAPHAVCSPTPPAAAGNPRTPARLFSCRFLRLRSRTSLPLTAEESPHASTSLPALQSQALRPVPSPLPPSRTFSPRPIPSPPVPQSSASGLEPPSVSPCSRAAFLPHPHSRRIPRIPDRTASLLPAPSVPEYGPVLLFLCGAAFSCPAFRLKIE